MPSSSFFTHHLPCAWSIGFAENGEILKSVTFSSFIKQMIFNKLSLDCHLKIDNYVWDERERQIESYFSWSGKSDQARRGDAKDGGDDVGRGAGGEPQVEQAGHLARLSQEAAARWIQVIELEK